MNLYAKLGKLKWKLTQLRKRKHARNVLLSHQQELLDDLQAHIDATRSLRGVEGRERRFLSQNGEDGVLVGLLDLIGPGPRRFIEIGFSIFENNCIALALYYNIKGLYLDSSEKECRDGEQLLAAMGWRDIAVVNRFITRDNINELMTSNGFNGELDILSIDIDGNDYWIWDAIEVVRPRIVICEFNASFGAQRSVTIPYEQTFDRIASHDSGLHHGASIQALTKLGLRKGYKLIGCDSFGLNLYFLRNDIEHSLLPQVDSIVAFHPHRSRIKRGLTQATQEQILSSLPVVDV